MVSFTPHTPLRRGSVLFLLNRREKEAQRGEVTCPRSTQLVWLQFPCLLAQALIHIHPLLSRHGKNVTPRDSAMCFSGYPEMQCWLSSASQVREVDRLPSFLVLGFLFYKFKRLIEAITTILSSSVSPSSRLVLLVSLSQPPPTTTNFHCGTER